MNRGAGRAVFQAARPAPGQATTLGEVTMNDDTTILLGVALAREADAQRAESSRDLWRAAAIVQAIILVIVGAAAVLP